MKKLDYLKNIIPKDFQKKINKEVTFREHPIKEMIYRLENSERAPSYVGDAIENLDAILYVKKRHKKEFKKKWKEIFLFR